MYLEINFNSQTSDAQAGAICCISQGTTGTAVSVSKPNIKFIYDALYYSDEQQQNVMAVASSSDGLSMLYEYLITTTSAVAQGSTTAGNPVPQVVERELALSGKVVRNILIQEQNMGVPSHKWLGDYISQDTLLPSGTNFRINDQRMYDRNVELPPRKYEELALAVGRPEMTPSQLYSYDVDSDKSNILGSLNQNSLWTGKVMGIQSATNDNTNSLGDVDARATAHYEGLDLTTTGENRLGNGQEIGVKPIRIEKTYYRTTADNHPRTIRSFASVEKVMIIKGGEVMISA
jgi:hypothetical protein